MVVAVVATEALFEDKVVVVGMGVVVVIVVESLLVAEVVVGGAVVVATVVALAIVDEFETASFVTSWVSAEVKSESQVLKDDITPSVEFTFACKSEII